MPYTMEELVRKRTSLQRNVVKLQALIVTYNQDTVDPSLLDLDVTRLLELKDKGERLYDATFDLCATDKQFTDDHETDFDVILMSIKNLQVKVMSMIRKLKEKKSDALSPSFKFERIKLPQFSGNFSEWQSFRDLFIASVHKNKTLSGAEKIIHLKTCLHGEAASIVSSFQTTEDNYKEAWECVLKRYNVKREIVFAHIKKFDELKPLKEESSSGLRLLADTVNECIRSLKVLEVPVETWDLILIYIALKKLDSETRKEWSLKQEDELPTLSQFIMFIESRARALQDAKPSASGKPVALPPAKSSLSSYPKKTSSSHATRQSQLVCANCAKSHHSHQCKDFASLSSADRRSFVLNNRLCFNCMFKGHSSLQCPVKFACKSCGAKHHTMLHEDSPHAVEGSGEAAAMTSFNTASAFSNTKSETVALLATLLVSVLDSRGQKQVCRVFMDSGSESNFITEGCVQRLGLKRQKACVTVSGIGGVAGESAKGLVNLQLHSHTTSFAIDISALIYRKLTNNLIPRQLCKSSWPHLKGLELSDPNFHVPSRIDILLGVADSGTILLPGLIQGPAGSPVAQLTQFGWTLSGSVDCDQSSHGMSSSSSSVQVSSSHVLCRTDTECLQDSLERFWELEEIESTSRALSSEDELCEQHFASTYNRAKDGSYTVQLPFRDADSVLGSSRAAAVKRLLRLESRLSTNPAVRAEYVKCIREGIESSFIEQIPVSELQNPASQCYYLPHREVVKESSTSTKVRIVYDASAKSDNGLSLNDILMTGPKLQADLVPLLIRFRSHLVAMSADIEKFYPQFKVDKNHTDFQRFVWRESAASFIKNQLWLHGPEWLLTLPCLNVSTLVATAAEPAFCGIIHDVSSFTKMKRIAAFCLRFINNCQGKRQLTGKLSAVELELGLHHLIKAVQAEAFSEEIQRCTRKQLVKSKVKFLCPFLDEKGILRVGGRLHHASEQFRSQHPVLLPSKHNFVNQLVRSLHLMHLHAGPQLLLALTREQYWIVRGLDAVKRIVHQCVVCQRYNPATATQLMGQLPPSRVRPSRPFSQCGVDYSGPFMLCLRPGRNPITIKAYVSLFICMATRAVHLELVEDLSTAAFIGALTRFISRCGLPAHIFSDSTMKLRHREHCHILGKNPHCLQ